MADPKAQVELLIFRETLNSFRKDSNRFLIGSVLLIIYAQSQKSTGVRVIFQSFSV